jgi:hypothetical protein
LTITADGKSTDVAITFKQALELKRRRVIEKLDIELEYWTEQKTQWGIVTELDLPEPMIRNLRWILPMMRLDVAALGGARGGPTKQPYSDCNVHEVATYLFQRIRQSGPQSLDSLCLAADDRFNYKRGTCLVVVRHCLAQKWWSVPLLHRIETTRPLRDLKRGPRYSNLRDLA